MHDVFEIALKSQVSDEQLIVFMAEHFGVQEKFITSEDTYWAEDIEGDEQHVGLTVERKASGLATNISGVSYLDLNNDALDKLTSAASRYFGCEAVVGDFRDERSAQHGAFLSYFPDGSVWESVDASTGALSEVSLLRQLR